METRECIAEEMMEVQEIVEVDHSNCDVNPQGTAARPWADLSFWNAITEDGLCGWVSTFDEALEVKKYYEVFTSLSFVSERHLNFQKGCKQKIRFSGAYIEGDGTPFILSQRWQYNCMFGRDKHAARNKRAANTGNQAQDENQEQEGPPPSKKQARKEKKEKAVKKMGCPANLHMREVTRFTDYKVEKNSAYQQRITSKKVMEALDKGDEIGRENRIYIKLPSDEDHNGIHSLCGEVTGFKNSINQEVLLQLKEFVSLGISSVEVVKRQLKIHVEMNLFPDPASRPSTSNKAYYPSEKVIKHHIYREKMHLSSPEMLAQAESWSNRMWQIVQRTSSFVWEGEKKFTYLPFLVGGTQVGIIPPMMKETITSQPDLFEWRENEIHLSHSLATYKKRTGRIAKFLEKCRQSGNFVTLNGWRNENFAVSRLYHDTPLLEMERSATCLFGIKQYGVHVNGYCRHPTDGMCMWVGRRSPNKQTYPGKLDQIAAGGLPAGLGIKECMMKECDEEANIPHNISSNAVSVGAISYFFEDKRGLFPETQFIYDLELPTDFQPTVKDGEVSEFYLWPLSKVKEEIASDDFKPNCSLVCLDFLMRHGHITPDDEPHYLDFLSRLHQAHF